MTSPLETVMGIDPGAGGALALVDRTGELREIRDMPTIEVKGKRRVVAVAVAEIVRTWNPKLAIIERSIAIKQQSADASMWFGYSAGLLEGVCAGMDLAVTLAYAVTWKRAMGVTGDKGGCRLVASRMWPAWHKHFARGRDDGRAEAALLAAYQVMQWTASA